MEGLEALPLERLESEITELAAHLNAAECRWLLLVAEFDRRAGWGVWGCRSCAHWLNWKCGIALNSAREKVRVAHCLPGLPLVTAAFAAGQLSYSKVRAISRVATSDNEEALLEMARAGTASHLDRIVRAYRTALGNEENDQTNRAHNERFLQWSDDDDGTSVLRVRFASEDAALVRTALDLALPTVDNAPAGALSPTNGTGTDTLAQRRADALVVMAESFVANGPAALRGGDRHLVTVLVGAAVLAGTGPGRCELDDGSSLAAETARRLSCDASLVGILEDGDCNPLNVGRKMRSFPPAIRRAIEVRDRGTCRFPGCPNRRFVDAHHVRHWCRGGETSLANGMLLCKFHHRAVHEGGYRIEPSADPGTGWVFLRPGGIVVPAAPPPLPATDASAVAAGNGQLGLDIGPQTAMPYWAGERLDLGLALQALFPPGQPERVSG